MNLQVMKLMVIQISNTMTTIENLFFGKRCYNWNSPEALQILVRAMLELRSIKSLVLPIQQLQKYI